MKGRIKLFMSAIIVLFFVGVFSSCTSDDEIEEVDYDATYDITYYNVDPNAAKKQGRWLGDEYIELKPQVKAPYNLYVKWSDEKGKGWQVIQSLYAIGSRRIIWSRSWSK